MILERMSRNVRHALRALMRSRGFAVIAILTLALGIGANTAIFSVLYGVLLKPLPFQDPDRLVAIHHGAPGVNAERVNNGPATYFTYREANRAFEDVAAWDTLAVSVTGRGEPERVEAVEVTDATLSLLRVQPALGRLFTKEDDAPGSPRRVILTHGYWQRVFGGANDVVGRQLEINGAPNEVIGVLPPSFRFLHTDAALLLPMRPDRALAAIGVFDFEGFARLKPGVTLSEANADVARMIPLLGEAYEPFRLVPDVRPLVQYVVGDIGRTLWILLTTVGIVLVIACANVANLFLVRAERRHHELAIRAALGASRGRIALELLSESLALGLAGGALGLVFAAGGVELLKWIAPAGLPRIEDIEIDWIVLLFTLAISLLTGLAFGLIPALRFGALSAATLKDGGRSASDAPSRHRGRDTLVVAEVALAAVLLIVSGLMIRTFVAMRQVDPGFVRPSEVQTFRIAVPEALAGDPRDVARLNEQIAERLQQVPGVASVGITSSLTMGGDDNGNPTIVEYFPVPAGELAPLRRFKYIGPGYFETMGNPVIAGRALTWTDVQEANRVVVISEALARTYWPQPSEALGKRITTRPEDPWREIVGVVENERDDGLNRPATSIVYWPMVIAEFWGEPMLVRRSMAYAVRSTRVGAPGFLRELQQAVWSVNPNLPLANVQTLDEIVADSMARTSFALVMLAIAASVALLLGVVGIYAVIAYVTAQRTREIGIRIALGARAANVCRLFLRHGVFLTSIGIVIGMGAALALTRTMSALLFGVSPMDPITYAAVAVGLSAVAIVATYIPARYASRIDPMSALRADT